ncbi:MAG: AraC family transcriptional regulator [Polyangiaceae bacterium]
MSAAASLLRAVLAVAVAKGVDEEAVLSRAGLSRAVLEDRDARIPTLAYLAAIRATADLTRCDRIGAEIAAAMDGAAFGAVGFLLASCANVREALHRFARYTRLLCDELRFEVRERDGRVEIVYALEGPAEPALFEMAMTHLVLMARRGTNGRFRAREVVFQHGAPPRGMEETIGAPVRFGGPCNMVVAESAALDLPLRAGNRTLLGILDSHVEGVLASLPREDDVLTVVRAAIRKCHERSGEPTLAAVAKTAGLGARTLQRRLVDRGVTFRQLVDDVRREIAVAELEKGGASIAEVAFALGFSSPSAFHHAFRRWTGRSPGRARMT